MTTTTPAPESFAPTASEVYAIAESWLGEDDAEAVAIARRVMDDPNDNDATERLLSMEWAARTAR